MACEKDLVKGLRSGVWAWWEFSGMEKLLFVDGSEDVLTDFADVLPRQVMFKRLEETREEDWMQKHAASFDAVLSIASLEKCEHPAEVLSVWRKLLKPEGRLLLGMNNRFGLRYFCGDRDPYTGRNFDGIEGYQHAQVRERLGHMYSQAEIREMLKQSGWEKMRFYSVLPGLEDCTLIYAEDTLPREDLSNRLFPIYNYPDAVFLEERELYAGLIKNGMFHQMANAYLIECAPDGNFSDVQHVTSSLERGREHAFFTLIHRDGMVEKKAAYPEGEAQLKIMAGNMERLKARGLSVVDGYLEGGRYVMPYMPGENGLLYLEKLLRENREKFLHTLDRFRDLVLQSSEMDQEDAGDGKGVALHHGYLDMVPWNTFYQDGEFIFFDQEFCVEHYPANVILMRTMGYLQVVARRIYGNDFPNDFLLRRYDLLSGRERWQRMEGKFFGEVKKEKELRMYHEKYRHNSQAAYTNRQRINYPDEIYQRLFVDIFHDLEGKKLLLFGSGRYADQFLALYGKNYPVDMILDNNKNRWGGKLSGVSICSPDALREMRAGTYRVILCIKDYYPVLRQLEGMGIKDAAIFDPNRDYPSSRKQSQAVKKGDVSEGEVRPAKRYRVGYIAGVFDLFHIGHLNMFRRAKEQCEHLIVGVVSDAGVRKYKEVEPFIPFDERVEIVRSCRYVDEAVEIPENYGGTRDAWRMYHFDVQFSGSDYVNDTSWLAEKEFLEKHGATMVFFPYTEQTSSTKIKALVEQRLEKIAIGK